MCVCVCVCVCVCARARAYMCVFLRQGILTTRPNPQGGGPPIVDCLRFPFQYLRRYSPHLVSLLRPQPVDVCHVVLTSTHFAVKNADWRIILKCILNMRDGTAWIGFIWLRLGTSDELFYKTYGLMKHRFSWSVEKFSTNLGTSISLWGTSGGKMGHCDRSLFQYFPPLHTHTHATNRSASNGHPCSSRPKQNQYNVGCIQNKLASLDINTLTPKIH